jgi:hypothetical protein
MRVRGNVTVILTVAVTAVGCGSSSTGPHKPAAANAALALHLDSLQQQAADSGEEGRFQYLSYPIAALAENVTPATISLTMNGSGQPFSAAGLEVVGVNVGSPTPTDSFFVFVAWSDSNATNIVFVETAPSSVSSAPDTIFDAEYLTGANDNSNFNVSSLQASLNSTGGACATTTLPFSASNDLVSGTTCQLASLSYQFAVSFTNPSSTFSFGTSSLPSARIVVPATGGQLRVPGRLAAALRRQFQPK